MKDKNGVCVEGMKIGKEIEQYFPQVYLILNISGWGTILSWVRLVVRSTGKQ